MEAVLVSGITYDKNEAKISVMRVPDKPGIAAKLFSPLSEANITVDMIIQNVSHEGYTDLTFTVPKADFKKALKIVQEAATEIGAAGVVSDENIAKVSIVGVGMRSHSGRGQQDVPDPFAGGDQYPDDLHQRDQDLLR